MSQVEQWFRDAVTDGVMRLLSLRLPSAPWEDESEYTTKMWIEALWAAPIGWDEEQDAHRLRYAFNRLGGQAERWPAPRQLLSLLPDRPQRARLPKPPMSEAKRKANRERLRSMIAELGLHSTRGDHHE
ncbi:MAG: hypothetical protein CME75_07955 [Halomonas sp.]|nr:hypothetical protein [Halomonas sp.]